MATNRELTEIEFDTLASSATFVSRCKSIIGKHAAYWSINNGVDNVPNTVDGRIQWAKTRQLSVRFLKNPIINEDPTTLARFFINASRGKVYAQIDDPQLTEAALIAIWDANNTFNEFVQTYFDIKGDEIDMILTGN